MLWDNAVFNLTKKLGSAGERMTLQQRGLLRLIDEAFRNVELGGGVSLHETEVIDLYGSRHERSAARERDETHDWRRLVSDPELMRVSGLSFFDAAGLRFHLPAYLSLAVTDPESVDASPVIAKLLYTLTRVAESNPERFALLSVPQRESVREVLRYLRQVYDLPENGPLTQELDDAIDGYWASKS